MQDPDARPMPSSEARVFPPPRYSRAGVPRAGHRLFLACSRNTGLILDGVVVIAWPLIPSAPSTANDTRRFVSCRTPSTSRVPALRLPFYPRQNPSRQPVTVPRFLDAWWVIGTPRPISSQTSTESCSQLSNARSYAPSLPPSVTTANPGSHRLAPDIHLVSTAKTPSLPYSHMLAIVRVQPIPIERSSSFGLPLAAHTLQDIPRDR